MAIFAKQLYASKAWTELRRNLIVERGPICQKCGRFIADASKIIGHHKIALTQGNISDINFTLNPNNIDIICTWCHNREPGHFNSRLSKNVYIVYGSPLSGKRTLVNQMLEYGDMIVDLDELFRAISGQELYNHPAGLRFNVFALRDKMIDMIKTRYGKWNDAYVITGGANKSEREKLAQELGAESIFCESTKAECLARAAEERAGRERWVEKWWDEYQP